MSISMPIPLRRRPTLDALKALVAERAETAISVNRSPMNTVTNVEMTAALSDMNSRCHREKQEHRRTLGGVG